MTDSSKGCKIYIIHCFLFSFSDPLISNFAQLPTIGNSKMPGTYNENYILAKVRFLSLSNNQSMFLAVLMFS